MKFRGLLFPTFLLAVSQVSMAQTNCSQVIDGLLNRDLNENTTFLDEILLSSNKIKTPATLDNPSVIFNDGKVVSYTLDGTKDVENVKAQKYFDIVKEHSQNLNSHCSISQASVKNKMPDPMPGKPNFEPKVNKGEIQKISVRKFDEKSQDFIMINKEIFIKKSESGRIESITTHFQSRSIENDPKSPMINKVTQYSFNDQCILEKYAENKKQDKSLTSEEVVVDAFNCKAASLTGKELQNVPQKYCSTQIKGMHMLGGKTVFLPTCPSFVTGHKCAHEGKMTLEMPILRIDEKKLARVQELCKLTSFPEKTRISPTPSKIKLKVNDN